MSNIISFAEACADQNTTQELIAALGADADQTDMQTWNLDESEYQKAIKLALGYKLSMDGTLENNPDVVEMGGTILTFADVIGEWANTKPSDCLVDQYGDIHDGRAWLTSEKLAEFYTWFADTHQ